MPDHSLFVVESVRRLCKLAARPLSPCDANSYYARWCATSEDANEKKQRAIGCLQGRLKEKVADRSACSLQDEVLISILWAIITEFDNLSELAQSLIEGMPNAAVQLLCQTVHKGNVQREDLQKIELNIELLTKITVPSLIKEPVRQPIYFSRKLLSLLQEFCEKFPGASPKVLQRRLILAVRQRLGPSGNFTEFDFQLTASDVATAMTISIDNASTDSDSQAMENLTLSSGNSDNTSDINYCTPEDTDQPLFVPLKAPQDTSAGHNRKRAREDEQHSSPAKSQDNSTEAAKRRCQDHSDALSHPATQLANENKSSNQNSSSSIPVALRPAAQETYTNQATAELIAVLKAFRDSEQERNRLLLKLENFHQPSPTLQEEILKTERALSKESADIHAIKSLLSSGTAIPDSVRLHFDRIQETLEGHKTRAEEAKSELKKLKKQQETASSHEQVSNALNREDEKLRASSTKLSEIFRDMLERLPVEQ